MTATTNPVPAAHGASLPQTEDSDTPVVSKPSRFDVRERPELLLVPAVFVAVLLLWEFGVKILDVKEYMLPAPTVIWEALLEQFKSDNFWQNMWVTLKEAGVGFAVGIVSAIILGGLISQFRLLEKTLFPYIVAFQTIPKVALAPLFVVWFGFGQMPKIVMAAIICFFPMLVNTIEGLKSADPDQMQMLRVFGASRMQIFTKVQVKSALPFIFAGLDLGIVFAILGAVVGEFLGAKEGLGYQLLQANYDFRTDTMFAVLIVLSVLGLIGHAIVKFFQKKFCFWAADHTTIGA